MIRTIPKTAGRLTERQAEVFAFILSHIQEHGYSPSVRDIGRQFDIGSPNGVMCHLRALSAKGYITAQPGLARAIRPAEGFDLAPSKPGIGDLEFLAAVAWLSVTRSRMPTLAELMEETGVNREEAIAHLERLRQFGCIYWEGEPDGVCILSPTVTRNVGG